MDNAARKLVGEQLDEKFRFCEKNELADIPLCPVFHAIIKDGGDYTVNSGCTKDKNFALISGRYKKAAKVFAKSMQVGTYFGEGLYCTDNGLLPSLIGRFEQKAKAKGILRITIVTRMRGLEDFGYSLTQGYSNVLSLEDSLENIWKAIKDTTKRVTRQAEKRGATVAFATTLPEFMEFYELYKNTMSPTTTVYESREFLRSIWVNLFPRDKIRLLLARNPDGKAVAGGLFLLHKESAYYWMGASDRNEAYLRPSNLIWWEFIKWAHRKGIKRYDMVGLTFDHNKSTYGTSRFKLGWCDSAEEVNLFIKTIRPARQKIVRIAKKLLGRF